MKRTLSCLLLLSLLFSGCSVRPTDVSVTDTEPPVLTDTAAIPVTTDTLTDSAPSTDSVTAPMTEAITEPLPAVQTPPPDPVSDENAPRTPIQISVSFDIAPNRYEYAACEVSITDPTGTHEAHADPDSQIKVRGHSTSSGDKIPYNIKLSEKTELLGLGKSKKWNLLANLYDRTQLRNMLALEFARAIGLETTSKSTFAELTVNGEYRGLYQICEPIDVGATALDLDTENGDFLLELEPYVGYENYYCLTTPRLGFFLGCNEPEMPDGNTWNRLVSFMTHAEDALLSGDWERVLEYFDVESFARCYIVQELFKNVDYAVSSTRFYIRDGLLYEGPVWDFDLSSGNCSRANYPDYNNIYTTGKSYHGLHCAALYNQYLFDYPQFTALVSDLYEEYRPVIVNLYRENEHGISRIDALLSQYGDALARNAAMWPTDVTYSHLEHKPADGTYDGEIACLRDWLEQRDLWLYDYYCGEH